MDAGCRAPSRDPFASLKPRPYYCTAASICAHGVPKTQHDGIIQRVAAQGAVMHPGSRQREFSSLATEQELSDFLKSVERRAFKRAVYHVRDEEAALDIVQDSMLKLSVHYGDKPPAELPMLFQRILSNCTLDWFRRQKTRKALFTNMSEFEGPGDDGQDFNLLESLIAPGASDNEATQNPENAVKMTQTVHAIEAAIEQLPPRQREAFLMRYWEDMDVAETAAAMGCSEGSVKTHCFRAVQTLSKLLQAQGIAP